jgi:hypothetical protein
MLFLAAFSGRDEALEWAATTAVGAWGPIAIQAGPFDFHETDYYQSQMGTDLKKSLFAFATAIDPGSLAQRKCQTNQWESQYVQEHNTRVPSTAELSSSGPPRPLNLDPGYLTEAKLVLASTKDHAHRIYLERGIYAEVTLRYQDGAWRTAPWTYADYRRREYLDFFHSCRDYLRRRILEPSRDTSPPNHA